MYSTYGYSTSRGLASSGNLIWIIISAVFAVVGGIVLFAGFLGWMYDFLTFKKMVIENILKVCYLIVAIFITLASFALISVNFVSFLLMLVIGNLAARIMYELFLVVLVICRNTTEINKKLGASAKVVPEEKKENE